MVLCKLKNYLTTELTITMSKNIYICVRTYIHIYIIDEPIMSKNITHDGFNSCK